MAGYLGDGIKDDIPTGLTPAKRQWATMDDYSDEEDVGGAEEEEGRDQFFSQMDVEKVAFHPPQPVVTTAAAAVSNNNMSSGLPNKARRTTSSGRIGVLGEKNPNVALGAGAGLPRKEKKERMSMRPVQKVVE
jgi:hypothetical protein